MLEIVAAGRRPGVVVRVGKGDVRCACCLIPILSPSAVPAAARFNCSSASRRSRRWASRCCCSIPGNRSSTRVDLVHYFSVQGGSMNFCDYVKQHRPAAGDFARAVVDARKTAPGFRWERFATCCTCCDRILPNSQAECDQLAEEFDVEPRQVLGGAQRRRSRVWRAGRSARVSPPLRRRRLRFC